MRQQRPFLLALFILLVVQAQAFSPLRTSIKFLLPIGEKTEISLPDLPVGLKVFQGNRVGSKVNLVWETASECEVSGFEVQRRVIDGEWKKVASVFMQDPNGKHDSMHNYEYTDVNVLKEISQYRLKKLSSDGQAMYSEVISVKGY